MTGLLLDARHVLRSLRRTPVVFATAALSLSVGIGANAVVFSWMDNLVVHPFPGVRDAERLVGLETRASDGGAEPVSYPMLRGWGQGSRSLSGIAAWTILRVSARQPGEANSTSLVGYLVSGNYFALLAGRRAVVLGRGLEPADETARAPVVVLGFECFRRQFAGDPAIVGRSVYLNGQAHTVVGVAEPNFVGTYLGVVPDLFVPITQHPALSGTNILDDRAARSLQAVARLAPGVTLAEAREEVDATARAQSAELGDRPVTGAVVEDARRRYLGGIVFPLFTAMLVVTGLLMLVSCANVAGILLVRATSRGVELAMRVAVGASRPQLARLVLLESALLAGIGALLGIGMAQLARAALYAFIPPQAFQITLPLDLNARVLGAAALLGAAVAILCGLVPMLRASRIAPATVLRGGTGAAPRATLRARFAIVGAQLAFSLVCLVLAAAFLRGLRAAGNVQLGFQDPEHVLLVNTDAGPSRATGTAVTELLRTVVRDVAAIPGVESATLATSLPLGFGGRRTVELRIEGRAPNPDENRAALRVVVGGGYAATMGIRVVEGREFDARDAAGSLPVALVNETLAKRFWSGASPIGRRFDAGRGYVTIVGVLQDGKYGRLAEAPASVAYFPFDQWPQSSVTLLARTSADPMLLAETVRRAVQRVHPDLPALQARTLAQHIASSTFAPRVGASVLSAFGSMALLISGFGLYAAIAFLVALRSRELGIRMALGAGAPAILRAVGAPVARTLGVATVVGLMLAFGAARVVQSRLSFVSAADPIPVLVAVLLLGALVLAALWAPARRALRVDAARVLRDG